jgi:hypothetical protein
LFGVGHLVATMNGRPMTSPDGFVAAIVPWLEANAQRRDQWCSPGSRTGSIGGG